jgi:hypothetical protein
LEDIIGNGLENKFNSNDFGKKEEIGYFLFVSPHRKRNGEEMFLFRTSICKGGSVNRSQMDIKHKA